MTKLDNAIVLAQHELKALIAGDIDKASLLMDERKSILEEVYEKHDENSQKEYLVKLIALESYNLQILEKGTALRDSMRKDIKKSSKTVHAANRYMRATF